MSFNVASMTCVESAAGRGVWSYYTTDNIASLAVGTINTGYFANGYKLGVRAGDLIIGTYLVNSASSSVHMFSVPGDWDSNGGSVIPCSPVHAVS